MEKQHGGHTWKIEELGDDSFSVLCLDPDKGDDGIDYTTWPDDTVISGWLGKTVSFRDGGDHPDYPEGIYAAV